MTILQQVLFYKYFQSSCQFIANETKKITIKSYKENFKSMKTNMTKMTIRSKNMFYLKIEY